MTIAINETERELLLEAVELLLSSTERQEHLAQPLHQLIDKLKQAEVWPSALR